MSRLFSDVIRKARLEPKDISLIEAHVRRQVSQANFYINIVNTGDRYTRW